MENKLPTWHWPDARGWIGAGVFAISIMLLWMMKEDRGLREDEFFQTIATVIISNGLMAVVAWAYAATKGGGELADKAADVVSKSAAATIAASVAATNGHAKAAEAETGELPEAEKLP